MVGRLFTPLRYTLLSSLNNNLRALPSMHNQLILQHCLPLITPPPSPPHTHTCTYPARVSSLSHHIPTRLASHLFPHIYLHSLHLNYPPTYTYTTCISSIPQIYLHCLRLIYTDPHMSFIFSLHLIYSPTYTYTACISIIPQHIPTLPVSHLSPKYTYTACVSFILIPTCHLSSDSKAKSSSQYQMEFFTRHLTPLICANFFTVIKVFNLLYG